MNDLAPYQDAFVVNLLDAHAEAHLDPQLAELQARALRQLRLEREQDPVGHLHQHDARLRRLHVAKVLVQDLGGEIGDRARQLDAGRAAPDDDEGEQSTFLLGIVGALGRFQRRQHAPPDLECVVEILETGRDRDPVVVAEIAGLGAGGDDQIVVPELDPVRQVHPPPGKIDPADLVQQDLDVCVMAEDPADRIGDVGRGQPSQRHLIEQRLEEVIVQAIDHRHRDVGPPEGPRGGEAPEPRTNDDHLRSARGLVHTSTLAGAGGEARDCGTMIV